MAAIGSVGSADTVESFSQETKKEYGIEEVKKLYRTVVAERILAQECDLELRHLKNLHILFVTPSPKLKKTCDEDAREAAAFLFARMKEILPNYSRFIEADDLKMVITKRSIELLQDELELVQKILLNENMSSDRFEKISKNISYHSKSRVGTTDILNESALEFRKITPKGWAKIKAVFDDNGLYFSEDFVKRCQQLLPKTSAA